MSNLVVIPGKMEDINKILNKSLTFFLNNV